MNIFMSAWDSLNYEQKELFVLLYRQGPLTKGDLALLANMALSTLNRCIHPMKEIGLVTESGTGESSGGRKPALFSINPSFCHMIGVDISRTYTQVIITDLCMQPRWKGQFKMDAGCSPQVTVERVRELMSKGLNELQLDRMILAGIGIGTVGPVNRKDGSMTNPVNFPAPGWEHVPLREMFETVFKCDAVLDNGANTAVLAEHLYGKGKGYRNIAYFHCGVGIRTGAITAGNILRAVNDREDAFGHMVVDVDGIACSCGNFGCIECYASIPAIVNRFSSEVKKGRTTTVSCELPQIGYLDICQAAGQGDELAREVIQGAAVVFGTGLGNYINLFNPELVVLSGPLIKHSPLFFEVSTDTARRKCRLEEDERVVFSRYGYFEESVIAVGAAAMVIENCLEK